MLYRVARVLRMLLRMFLRRLSAAVRISDGPRSGHAGGMFALGTLSVRDGSGVSTG
ncbi:hypothetical protein [Sphingobacterium sp.]|uniref:hypothetical protein n=1 Tax=Sphingobacterium sp. TaxID=341027 RepID=UPI002898F826|nr:hypothetical protein [Sphingobacterium sp.]